MKIHKNLQLTGEFSFSLSGLSINNKTCTRVQDFCTAVVVYWPDKKEPGQPK